MKTITIEQKRKQTMHQQMDDITDFVSWGMIANDYFSKSASWFYHKLNGTDGNKKPTEFNIEERVRLKGALCDLADRIRRAADTIET